MDYYQKFSEVFNLLSDDKSKQIFLNRLLYNITKDYTYIINVVKEMGKELIDKFYEELLKKSHCDGKVVVWGAGNLGRKFIEDLNFFKIDIITAVCDSDKSKQGLKYYGYDIISIEELVSNYNEAYVVITIWADEAINEILNHLLNLGFTQDRIVILKKSILNSSKVQYFDKDIILSKFTEDEVFIDSGCCNFSTSLDFIEYAKGAYKKIIAFEPSSDLYYICVERSKNIKNSTVLPMGLWNKDTELCFNDSTNDGTHRIDEYSTEGSKIKAVKLDDILDGEEATFIKMDIEGAELNALKGAEQTILKYRPKLAICVYHKPEDIIDIPLYLNSLVPEYKFFMRHYRFGYCETVLYAVI